MAASFRLSVFGLCKSLRKFSRAEFVSYTTVTRHLGTSKKNFDQKLFFTHAEKKRNGGNAAPSLGVLCALRGIMGFFEKKDKEEEDPVKVNIRLAYLSIKKEQFREAENYYHLALHAADEQFKLRKIDPKKYLYTRVYIYDGMANLALSQGELLKAEKLYKETMKGCLQKGVAKTDNSMVELSVKLASVYALMGREVEAREGYKFCINTQEAKIKEDPDADENTFGLLGLSLESYARLLIHKKEFEEAETMLKQSEEIATKYLGEDHPQRIVILNDLASVQILKADYSQAEVTLRQAVRIGEITRDVTLPVLYCNLGSLYLRTSDYEKALKNCQTGLNQAKEMRNREALNKANYCINKAKEAKEAQEGERKT